VEDHDPFDPERAQQGADADDRETPYALLARGRELMHGRHFAQAAVVLERAARLEPGRGSILEALGRASYNAGHHGRAAEVFEDVLVVDPSSHYAHYALGQSLKRLGRAAEAGTHLRIAVALSPGSRLYASALRRHAGAEGPMLVVGDRGHVPADPPPVVDPPSAAGDVDPPPPAGHAGGTPSA
jgi:tetratricopeptide (TPR) repeat protein